MSSSVMKVEVDTEMCCVCGSAGELVAPEEYDAAAPPMSTPLRSVLARLAGGGCAAPEGRLCASCLQRALEAHEFAAALRARAPPPLSDRIRALRRRLGELTQKIDVFIVVGGGHGGAAGEGRAYSEDDIIMVERGALAAAAEPAHARNARGDAVYQCSVCPLSFQTAAEYRSHAGSHPLDSVHSCWTCGAQFADRSALHDHAAEAHPATHTTCYICNTRFQSQLELKRHEVGCAAVCPACGSAFPSRRALGEHCVASHGRHSSPPHLCPSCFSPHQTPDALASHMMVHRQHQHFVCGYGDCVLRFPTRVNLMTHIRKCHSEATPEDRPAAAAREPSASRCQCPVCHRTFATLAALRRHERVHRARADHPPAVMVQELEMDEALYLEGDGEEGEVEYLEVETLDEEEFDLKPDLTN